MIRALRHRIAPRHDTADDGVTLTELLVAASLSLLVLTMVAAMFIQTAQMTASATQNRNSTTVASTAAADISNVIRGNLRRLHEHPSALRRFARGALHATPIFSSRVSAVEISVGDVGPGVGLRVGRVLGKGALDRGLEISRRVAVPCSSRRG